MSQPLTAQQLSEVHAICDEIREQLEAKDEYSYDLDERRGKPGSFPDEVWDEALKRLRASGYITPRMGAVLIIRKR